MKKLYAPLKNWAKKPFIRFAVFVLLLSLLLFLFRQPLLRGMYTFLNVSGTTPLTHASYGFILSGNASERAAAAAALFHQGRIDTLICTGSNVPSDLAVLGLNTGEGELSRMVLLQNGVPPERIRVINQGSSTREEIELVRSFCTKHPGSIALISTASHTRRIWRLRRKMLPSQHKIYCVGVPPGRYNPHYWWQSEEGLIAVNTEWQKLLYYYWKY